jgi:hypothetical protein
MLTIYDRTQLEYTYFERLLEVEDLTPYREKILDIHEKCKFYSVTYEEAIYGQFLRLIQSLIERI